ncbi:hypothetical protein ACKAV7_011871 [Fusarium commune]
MSKSTSVILELNELCCEYLAAEDVAASFMTSIETVVAEMRQPGIKCAARLPGLLYKFLLMKHGPPNIATVEKLAAATWEVLLQSLWPQFLAVAEPAPPESFTTEALDVAQRLGLSVEKVGQVTDAKKAYENLFGACKKNLGVGDVKIAFAADRLADILQQEGLTTAAVEL